MKKRRKHTVPKEGRICWCPCRCNCTEPHDTINPSGLCPDCERGGHEVPPHGVTPGVEELLRQHRSIVLKYEEVLELMKRETAQLQPAQAAESVLILEGFPNNILRALDNAVRTFGHVHPVNKAYAPTLQAKLIREDGAPYDPVALRALCITEVNRRIWAGTYTI